MRALFPLMALCALTFVTDAARAAETANFRDWTVACEEKAAEDGPGCTMYQRFVRASDGLAVGALFISQPPESSVPLMSVMTPLGVDLKRGVAITRDDLTALGGDYVRRLTARAPEAERITDKMPANFFLVGLIHLMLPKAKIVHVRRSPLDTCLSNFTRLFGRNQFQSYDLRELGLYYRDYARVMAHWREVLPKEAFHEIQYEDLVTEPEAEVRRLLAYLDLPWDDACLAFHESKRQVRTASMTQVREPIHRGSVGRWKRYERFLGPLIEALGDQADID